MESFFKNPGFLHIGEKILKNLDFKNQVTCRLVQKSWKSVLDKLAPKVGVDDLLQILQKDLIIPCKESRYPSGSNAHSNLDTIYEKWSKFLKLIKSKEENPWIFVMINYVFKDLVMMYRYTKQITLYSPFNTFITWTVKLRVVKFILENKDELNFIDELESYSVVPQLVFKKQIEVMAVLKPHLTNFQSRYAICLATQEGHIEFLKLLKDEFHNDLIARYPGGATLLHEAAKRGHAEVVEFLLTHTKLLATDEDDSGVDYCKATPILDYTYS